MAWSPGERIGHYVISAPLGAGGMGEVYRAQDTRLGRDVAIKVLPAAVAADAERLARFEREARLLASLNHPNVATLFGLETVTAAGPSPVTCLVMELVEGDDLEGRLAGGPIPIREAVAMARQIAYGLEAAHGKGIVHRDLKPANIRITPDGTVKILDFGLAKSSEPLLDEADVAESPTLTGGMTREGTILGTAPYMSPEQARSDPLDRRTDIWAFGCVLYEMLAGKRAFAGGSWPEVLAHILDREPDWDDLPPTVPTALRRLLGRCLEKEPKRRLRDAGDAALALEDLELEQTPPAAQASAPPEAPSAIRLLPWLVAAVASIGGIAAWVSRGPEVQPEAAGTIRFSLPSPAPLDVARVGHSGSAVAVSPDGGTVVWVGVSGQTTQLFLRRLAEDASSAIDGTEGALTPFFSPDGAWIGFWADGKLKKVAERGGVPQTICETSHVHGASWGDGMIVLSATGDGSLWSVDAGGGELQPLEPATRLGVRGEYPKLMPGSKAMLVTNQGHNTVDLVSLETGAVTTLVREGSNGNYLRSGHLMWTQQDSLLAAPFDLASGTITGDAQTVIQEVLTESHVATLSHYAISDGGTLAYLPGAFEVAGQRLTWVKLDGTSEPLALPVDTYLSPRVSPDGQRLLLSRQSTTRDFWLAEPGRGVLSPLTGDEGDEYWGIWTRDGTAMVYNSARSGEAANLWMQPVDRTSPPTRLTTAPQHQPPADMTRDGRTVVFGAALAATDDLDVHLLHLDGTPATEPLLDTDANEVQPKLSPDDRWLAYASDVTGRLEVYVQPFPSPGAAARVSPSGGQEPLWSPSGDRLYYRSANGRQVFTVDVLSVDPLRLGREDLLFEGSFVPGIIWGRKWDIHPDGDRFLMLAIDSTQSPKEIRVVANWFTELERLVPPND